MRVPDFSVVIRDNEGDKLEFSAVRGVVYLNGLDQSLFGFGPAERGQFAQAWIAASHEADQQGASDG